MTLAQVQRIRAGHQAQIAERDAQIAALTSKVAELEGNNDPAIQAELDAFEAEVNPPATGS